MSIILVSSRGAFALFSASHDFSFRVLSDCYMMAAHRVLGLTTLEQFSTLESSVRVVMRLVQKLVMDPALP
jgi:hypothetical protein